MPNTVAATKKSARTPAPSAPAKPKPAKTKKVIPSWIGSGIGKGVIKPGVDLTKPTLLPGAYL